MTITDVSAQIPARSNGYSVKIADSSQDIFEAHRLRHQVYCLERGFLPNAGNVEVDEFDKRSRHIVAREDKCGQIVGTARLILPSTETPKDSYPMQRVCSPGLLSSLPQRNMAEVSRFAISKELRSVACASTGVMRLSLMRGLVYLSDRLGLTHWCAVMEPSLFRLFRASAMYFHALGPIIEYHGPRQPCYIAIDEMLNRVRREKPEVWEFLTDHGRLWRAHSSALLQAA